MNTIYYIPKLDEIVLMVSTKVTKNEVNINLNANLEAKEEIEKLTYGDMTYIGEL